MLTHFPQAVPEIPVSSVDKAARYYVTVLGFSFDWGNDDGGIGGISQGDCRMFLTNAPFRAVHGPKAPVIVWLNLNSKQEVDELFERWENAGAKIYEGRTATGLCESLNLYSPGLPASRSQLSPLDARPARGITLGQ